jgi:MOSC domain-containing protein YiiM
LRNGEPVSTAIFKEPVDGRIPMRKLNLDGDRQADLSVHGGPDKAVYVYPAEHYDYWRTELPEMDLPWGMFGENLTIEGGLEESSTNVGDRFRAGSALVMVTQPRLPCYKLGIRFGRSDMLKRFLASGRTGFYLAVLEEGEVAAGDSFELVKTATDSLKISEVTRLYVDKSDADLLKRAIAVPALPESWRDYFQKYLDKLESEGGNVDDKE